MRGVEGSGGGRVCGGGVREDVNEELKFLGRENSKKKNWEGWGGRVVGGSRERGGGQGGCE